MMYATNDFTYTVSAEPCDHCDEFLAVVTLSREVNQYMGIWQHLSLPLHKDDAMQFGEAVRDAITVAEMEAGL